MPRSQCGAKSISGPVLYSSDSLTKAVDWANGEKQKGMLIVREEGGIFHLI